MTGEVTRTQVAAAGPGATLLYDDWYPALRSSKIAGKHMATAMLLGIPLVLERTAAGRYFALRDTRPHRGIPLSYGWFDGQQENNDVCGVMASPAHRPVCVKDGDNPRL